MLRLAIPDIHEYPNSRPALVFHATHDDAEKVVDLFLNLHQTTPIYLGLFHRLFILLQKVICSIGFRMEFLGQATGNDGWYGRGFYFSTVPAYCHHYQVDPLVCCGCSALFDLKFNFSRIEFPRWRPEVYLSLQHGHSSADLM